MAGKVFYATLIAGAVFIVIGAASSIYSGIPREVSLDYIVGPSQLDIITPNMIEGGTADITLTGSSYEISITDPEGTDLIVERGNSTFNYELTAQKTGEYRFLVNNTGTAELGITGNAETTSSALGLTGALMLVITGIILIGLGLRFRKH